MANANLSASTPTLSVILPVHQDGEVFRRAIRALAAATPQPDEVLIISDGAPESVVRFVKEVGFRCLKNPAGNGPAKARNYGAACAGGDILFFVDSDVAIREDSIRQIKTVFAENADLAAIIGSYDDAPADPDFHSQFKNLIHHYVHQNSNEETSTFWGACGAIRREVFLELYGFDENYRRPCIEDIEFGYRIRKAGHRIRLVKTLYCKHLKKWGAVSLIKSDLLDRAIPWTELIVRNRMLINDLNLRPANRLSVALVFSFILFMAGGLWDSKLAVLSLLCLAAVLGLNLAVYRFFFAKRKLLFMLRAIPWHLIYYICCGLGFAIGFARVFSGKISVSADKKTLGKLPVRLRKSA